MLDIIRTRTQSWVVKVIFAVIILVFVFWGIGNMGGMSASSIASIDGDPISLVDFQRELSFQVNSTLKENPDIVSNEAKFNMLKQQVLTNMVARLLRKHEAARLGIIVTPHELKVYRDSLPVFHDAAGKFDENVYARMLEGQGLTSDRFLTSLEQDILDEKLMGYIGMSTGITEAEAKNNFAFSLGKRVGDYVLFDLDEYKNKTEVTDAEVAEFFEKNKEVYRLPERALVAYLPLTPEKLAQHYPADDAAAQQFYDQYKDRFAVPESYQMRHIYIPAPADEGATPADEAVIAEARKQMDEVAAKAKAGEDFAELAKKYSKDEAAASGGMLPMLEKGTLGVDALDNAALALEPDQISEPIRTPVGFHLIKLVSKKPEVQKTFAEVKEEILDVLSREKAGDDIANVEKEAEDGLAMGTSLADIGKKYGVAVEKTELLPQSEVEALLELDTDSRQIFIDTVAQVAESGKAETVPAPLSSRDGLVLVSVEKAVKSEIPALDAVKDKVTDAVKIDKARSAAAKDAQDALPSFTGQEVPAAFAERVRQTAPVIRVFPEVGPLGLAPGLAEAMFNAPLGTWLPNVYQTEKGPAIVRPASDLPFAEADWQKTGGIFSVEYQQHLINETVKKYLEALAGKSKIEVQQKVFDSIRPR